MRIYKVIVFLLIPFFTLAQNDLDEKKGFQDIILGSNPKENKSLDFKKTTRDDQFKKSSRDEILPEVDLYEPAKGLYNEVGGIKIYKLVVKAFDNKIFAIELIAEKDPNFYKGLEQKYGEATYSLPNNSYNWSGKEVRLSFKSHSSKKVKLTYFMFAVKEWIKQKEKETLQSIADDF